MPQKSLYDAWGKRNPRFETKMQQEIIEKYADYGVGSSSAMESRGKLYGAGYEVYIIAFFIGLYADRKQELTGETKVLGQPIQYWGNIEARDSRSSYSEIRDYMFIALVAKTEIDFIALEKGELPISDVVTSMIRNMEGYANFGFHLMQDKITDNPDYFYRNTGFLDFLLEVTGRTDKGSSNDEVEQF